MIDLKEIQAINEEDWKINKQKIPEKTNKTKYFYLGVCQHLYEQFHYFLHCQPVCRSFAKKKK